MAAIIGPGGPFTAAKNGPGPFLAAVNGPLGPVYGRTIFAVTWGTAIVC